MSLSASHPLYRILPDSTLLVSTMRSSVCYTNIHTIPYKCSKKSRIETADQPTSSLVSLTLLWTPSDWPGKRVCYLYAEKIWRVIYHPQSKSTVPLQVRPAYYRTTALCLWSRGMWRLAWLACTFLYKSASPYGERSIHYSKILVALADRRSDMRLYVMRCDVMG